MYKEQTPSHCQFFDRECYMEYIADCQWWLKQNDNCDSIDVTIRLAAHCIIQYDNIKSYLTEFSAD